MERSGEVREDNTLTQSMSHPPPGNRASLRLKTEASREREAFRYLHSWIELHKPLYIGRNAFPTDHPMPAPAACTDTALAAFAQLAALRMGARRAFITVITTHTEHVLAESTKTMSLQSDFVADPRDESWLGTCCFPRSDGINDLALDSWRKARSPREIPADNDHYYTESLSSHWHIISDIRENTDLGQREFVRRAKLPRFYYSIPLREKEGTVIGSLSILDDSPRYGVSALEMSYCEDLGDTITQHLQSSIFRSQRQRSERLIQALGVFNNGGSSLRQWWIGQDNSSMRRGGRNQDSEGGRQEQNSRFDSEFGAEEDPSSQNSLKRRQEIWKSRREHTVPRSAAEGNQQAVDERIENGVVSGDFSSRTEISPGSVGDTTGGTSSPGNANTTPVPPMEPPQQTHQSEPHARVTEAYGRASRLLREAMGVSGVAFIDAGKIFATAPEGRSTSSGSSDDGKTATTSDTDASDPSAAAPRSKSCKVTAISTQAQKAEESSSSSVRFELLERDMAKLIKAYPRGKVFTFMKDGTAYSSSDGKGDTSGSATGTDVSSSRVKSKHSRRARILQKAMGDVGSIAFYPIWDDDRGRWRSVLLIWTKIPTRFFHPDEDLTYMSAFAHSLRAELMRIDTVASDVAKGRFISSVSHELRSPLHGILAGIELLQDSPLTPFQEEMTVSVGLAGRTLLDTVDHILDYSKISNLSRDQKKDRTRLDALRHNVTEHADHSGLTDVDLACLTEEVVESTTQGFRHLQRASNDLGQHGQRDVSVTLDIEQRDSWTTPMMPGTMTRLITNILGNALKFTTKGSISVKLYTEENNKSVGGEGTSKFVNLQIKDTGIGMSHEFQETSLFTAFKQANAHSTGTGLGMSIVREVAKDLNAFVGVKSDLGKGTVVSVRFLTKFKDPEAAIAKAENADSKSFLRKVPGHFRLLDLQSELPLSDTPGAKTVAESVLRTASSWPNCDASFAQDPSTLPQGTLCAVAERDLIQLDEQDPGAVDRLMSTLAGTCSQILVLSQSVATVEPAFDFEDFDCVKPLYIYQPIGPQKLVRVINSAKDSMITRKPADFAIRTPRRPRMIRGHSHTTSKRELGAPPYSQLPAKPNFQAELPSTSSLGGKTSDTEMPGENPGEEVNDPETPMPSSRKASLNIHGDPSGQVVLLVEDNDINMRLLVALMKKINMPCEKAANGLEALEAYQAAPLQYFLVLMDMNMPVMDGFEATLKIRELERKLKIRKVQIAAITGVTNAEAKKNAEHAGVNKYVTKPVRMKDLTALIDEMQEL